jgi:hypothetical protein
MKNWVILLVILVCSHCVPGKQMGFNGDFNKKCYQNAFIYITEAMGTDEIYTVDSLVYIEKNAFDHYLKLSNESYSEAVDRLINLDELHQSDPAVYCKALRTLKKIKKPKYYLFFSKQEDGILFAEILGIKSTENYAFRYCKGFNNGKRFMFVFDQNEKIAGVHTLEISYD